MNITFPATLVVTDSATALKKNISLVGPLKLYVCGITPYDAPHVGHGRCYVTFDILVRLARAAGCQVTYVRNFTDIDDKLLRKAQQELGDQFLYPVIADRYIQQFHEDMSVLNTLPPTHEPRVTYYIPDIIVFVQEIIAAGHAYVVGGDVYYRVRSYPDYGKLSGRHIDQLRAGARVELNTDKEDPLDFALWKSEPEGTFFKSPWGWGRPGWHIECSAMARALLGHTVDIHGGGLDLLFPHHENEQAQSQVVQSEPFVHTWMHNAFVQVNKEKMSKSLGNFFTLRDLCHEYTPQVVRFYFLQHQYRNPIDFDRTLLVQARTALARIILALKPAEVSVQALSTDLDTNQAQLLQELMAPLYDDLNTPGFFGVLHTHMDYICSDDAVRAQVVWILQNLLGLTLVPIQLGPEMTPEIERLLQLREAARVARDFVTADALRDELKKLGYVPQDKKTLQ
jgi:cysteinyl-tRNA synthetase